MVAALQGYRVLDFGTAWAGCIPGHILADFGAEVIKIESRQRVDLLRYGPGPRTPLHGKPWEEARECNPWFHAVNRGKLGVTLNFTSARGADLIRQLVRQSDIVVDNFTPGVLRKYDLHYEALARLKPDLIMASVSVAGQQGPYCDTRAYAFNLHALSGLCSLIGYTGDTVPRHIDIAYADWNAGMFATYAILLALYHRRRTGEGQFIDVSAWEATTALLTEGILDYTLNQRIPGPQDNHHPAMAPHGYYPCQGDDRWLALAIRSDAEWQRFCEVMGHAELAREARFRDGYQRLAHRDALNREVAALTRTREADQLAARLQAANLAAMPLCTAEGRFYNPHHRARQTHVEIHHPGLGKEWLHTIPWHLSDTPPHVRGPAPRVGEHNPYVLGELLGLSPDVQLQLAAEGVL